MAYGLFRRKTAWYWRGTWRRHVRHPGSFRNDPVSWSLDIVLGLEPLPPGGRTEAAMRLSAMFTTWMQRLEMLGLLEKLSQDEVKALVGWSLADIRDLYVQRVPDPGRIDSETRDAIVQRLRDEAACIQSALDTGNFEMVEGIAASLLRRRSIRCDFHSGEFAGFVRAVAPNLIEARLNELVRLGAPLGASTIVGKTTTPAMRQMPISLPPQPTLPKTPTGHPVSGKTVEDCLERFIRERRMEPNFRAKTESQYRQTIGMVIEVYGNVPIYQISRQLASEFKALILSLPKKYGQSAHYTKLALQDIPARAREIRDESRMTPQTWNRHQVALAKVWEHALTNGDVVENVFSNQRFTIVRKDNEDVADGPAHKRRATFKDEGLKQLFGSPAFTGMRSDRFRYQPGDLVEHNAFFWIPILMFLTGIRREEAAQLKFVDIDLVNGIECLRIRKGKGQTLKRPNTARDIPIPSALRRLGFMDFVADRKAGNGEFIFHECKPTGKFRRRGEVVGKAFGRYLTKIGLGGSDLSIYSLRHDFSSLCVFAEIRDCLHDRLMGHKTGRLAIDVYAHGLEAALQKEIEKIDCSCLEKVRPYRRSDH